MLMNPTVQDRWGKVGKQIIEDKGPVGPERMKTLDNEIRDTALDFMQRSVDEGEPFFSYINLQGCMCLHILVIITKA